MKLTDKRIGVAVSAADSNGALSIIEDLEQRGVPAAWMTTGSAGGADSLSLFAVAAARTQEIMLGTAITQTFPQHPVAVAKQVQVLAQLAPERFRLGLGTSGRSGMEQTLGANFRAPLSQLREYIRIEKALLQQGSVDFSGRFYEAHTSLSSPVNVPVMAAALGVHAFQLCGAESDGAISWVCPVSYLRDVALPAMRVGADRAERPVPPLVAHLPVCVHDDANEAREAVRHQFAIFPRAPFYQNMFIAAGFPEASQGTWSDAMVDAVAACGDESRVSEDLQRFFTLGAAEILVSPVPAGADRDGSLDRTLRLIAQVATSTTG